MTIDTAKRARALLKDKEDLQKFLGILCNYDSSMEVVASSYHNDNRGTYIEKRIPISKEIQDAITEYVRNRIDEVNKSIEAL